jgi:hypothetical protein
MDISIFRSTDRTKRMIQLAQEEMRQTNWNTLHPIYLFGGALQERTGVFAELF